ALGFERFAVVGHDRGARVAHRMALDHGEAVSRAALLDIVPTREVFARVDAAAARSYYHWFFLIQPAELPERLIAGDPEYYLRRQLGRWGADSRIHSEAAMAEYLRCFRRPETIHASCEDYRAAASIDLAHDEADLDRKVECPLLALWGSRGVMARYFDVLATWRERARDVRGRALDCAHYVPEEVPEATARELKAFLTR
ncbi:MAG TPA: alpha/beta hydrolase, partial [Dongiaceae bacterium]|nr:alpha/beta hydrolase [Dongiaceae bacterium]